MSTSEITDTASRVLFVTPICYQEQVRTVNGTKAGGHPEVFLPSDSAPFGHETTLVPANGQPFRFMSGNSSSTSEAIDHAGTEGYVRQVMGHTVEWVSVAPISGRFTDGEKADRFNQTGQNTGYDTIVTSGWTLVATPKLEARTGTAAGTEVTHAELKVLYAEDRTDLDGVWWDPSFVTDAETPAWGVLFDRCVSARQ